MDITEKKYKVKAAKTHKGRVAIENKLPKLIEDPKRTIFVNTINSSEIMRMVATEFYFTRKTFSLRFNKKNNLDSIFEKTDSLEYLIEKNDSALFLYTSDSKKRPMNLVIGNCFEHKILDAFEFEVTNFIPLEYFEAIVNYEPNCQPILLFQGELFETDNILERFKKLMLDFYAQDLLEEVNISELKRVICFTVDSDKKIKIRNYQIKEINEYNLKNLNLEEVGPSFDLSIRRNILAGEEDYKKALRQPKFIGKEFSKNKINGLFDVQGKLYTQKQNLEAASLRRFDKILSRKRKTNVEALENHSKLDKNNNLDLKEDVDEFAEGKEKKKLNKHNHKDNKSNGREKSKENQVDKFSKDKGSKKPRRAEI